MMIQRIKTAYQYILMIIAIQISLFSIVSRSINQTLFIFHFTHIYVCMYAGPETSAFRSLYDDALLDGLFVNKKKTRHTFNRLIDLTRRCNNDDEEEKKSRLDIDVFTKTFACLFKPK